MLSFFQLKAKPFTLWQTGLCVLLTALFTGLIMWVLTMMFSEGFIIGFLIGVMFVDWASVRFNFMPTHKTYTGLFSYLNDTLGDRVILVIGAAATMMILIGTAHGFSAIFGAVVMGYAGSTLMMLYNLKHDQDWERYHKENQATRL